MNRREFIGGAAAAAGILATGRAFAGKADEIRGALLHFGTNMWQKGKHLRKLDFDEQVWRRLTDRMAELGFNTVFVDVGEALNFPSHPELAVEGGWSPDRFRGEMRRLKAKGLEPIPKLNFSSTHNAWMGVYRRMTGTAKYYQAVQDLIRDTYEVFDRPRYFHIGMDEETLEDQLVHDYEFVVARHGELLWRDFNSLVKTVEDLGARAMSWGGMVRTQEEGFLKNVPRSVLLTVGYYRNWFDYSDRDFPKVNQHNLRAYEKLDRAGFEMVPCASNCVMDGAAAGLVKFCRATIAPAHLKGFMTAPWEYSIPYGEPKCRKAIDELGATF